MFSSKTIKLLTLILVAVMLSACGKGKVTDYEGDKPKMDIKEYFNGPIMAWGIVQDWRGRVIKRFDVTMSGEWNGDNGVLKEEFRYYDGKTQQRTWKIKKINDNNYAGTAEDILDQAKGEVSGSACRWSYEMDLPVDNTTYRIKFDDWMWLMNGDVLINRSYMKKFGITVGELTIFMQKQK